MCLRLSIWLCLAMLAASAHSAPVYPTPAEAKQLLTSNQFEVLDQRYGAIQTAYRDGAISEIELRAAFRAFYDPDQMMQKNYLAWVALFPKSYVAHLASGIYFLFLGSDQRGTGFASETSDGQFEAMHAAYKTAAREFAASLALETKPLLTYHHSIDLANDSGDLAVARALLDKAIAIDPRTFIVREKYMGALRTRWGGSVEQMKAFLTESRQAAVLSREQLNSLESLVLEDEAWVKQFREHDEVGAIQKYREAAALDSARNCEICGPAMQAANLLQGRNDHKGAVEQYSVALARNPDLIDALIGRAFSQMKLGNRKLAADDFKRSAELGNPYGQTEYAKMLLAGDPVPRDEESAMALMEKAAAQGYAPAQELLPVVRSILTKH